MLVAYLDCFFEFGVGVIRRIMLLIMSVLIRTALSEASNLELVGSVPFVPHASLGCLG